MPERLSKTVADDLLARIRRGEYHAGDRLPSEHLLMSEYGVGRNTVREAMQSLRTLGIVEIRPRLGARVLDTGAHHALATSAMSVLLREKAVEELYEIRLILEPAAAERAARNRTEDDLVAMRRAITHFRVAYETGTPVWEADIAFHQAVADACGNTMLAQLLAPVSDLLSNARQATTALPAVAERALEQHDEIAAAIQARAGKRARRAMTSDIETGIWALSQLREDNQPADPSAQAQTPEETGRDRARARRRTGRRTADPAPAPPQPAGGGHRPASSR